MPGSTEHDAPDARRAADGANSTAKAPNRLATSPLARSLWLGAGLALVGLGILGLFLPLVPTFDFLILALPCFARSSPRLENWLLSHPRIGPGLKAWRRNRAVPRTGKRMAVLGMSAGFAIFVVHAHPSLALSAPIGLGLLCAAAWVVTRPESTDE
ncbi:YbaN family protein [Novosphingobium profundi]|uniref:YbaN family protein n=1 Tax=Novosphingobium profundi TaxID=1774954 RepID=UPI001BDB3BD1|nr:YbaN family protein [Novosphingobium profundi]